MVSGVLAVALAGTAMAHSQLISMAPADGSLIQIPPTSVVLTFDQNIQDVGDGVIVLDPSGSHVEVGKPVILNNTVTENLKPFTAPGHYTVDFRVTSADGHPVSKQLGFDYLVKGTPATTPSSSTAGSGASAAILLGGAAVVIAMVGLLLWVVLRRRPTSTQE